MVSPFADTSRAHGHGGGAGTRTTPSTGGSSSTRPPAPRSVNTYANRPLALQSLHPTERGLGTSRCCALGRRPPVCPPWGVGVTKAHGTRGKRRKRRLRLWLGVVSPQASVAGAWNALFGLDRADPAALDQDLVVEQLKQCLRERIDAKCRKCVRACVRTRDTLLSLPRAPAPPAGTSHGAAAVGRVCLCLCVCVMWHVGCACTRCTRKSREPSCPGKR